MLVAVCVGVVFGRDSRIQIADGTADEPKRFDLQPFVGMLDKSEIDHVRTTALSGEFADKRNELRRASDEPISTGSFIIEDVAQGFFVSREFESRAYLYTAVSHIAVGRYQGILVLTSFDNNTRFKTEKHVIYGFRGDKHIRAISDLNGNFLSELAIFGISSEKTRSSRWLRMIEFDANETMRIGAVKIYSKELPQNRIDDAKGKAVTKDFDRRVASTAEALKVFFVRKPLPGVHLEFEEWSFASDTWLKRDRSSCGQQCLQPDMTDYVKMR